MVQHRPALNPAQNPLVSVCIAHYRGTDILSDCIDSVLNQDCDFRVEIIVHDDASDPDALALLSEKYPQVTVLASDSNVGFCVANNRMVEQAKGKYVLLLNNDAALYKDGLSTLVASAHDGEAGILTLPQYDWITDNLVDRGCLLDPFYNPIPNYNPEVTNVAMVIGACLWISKQQWNQLGGFPSWLGSIGEDLYLCCVARLFNIPVKVTQSSGYRHRQGFSFGGNRVTSDSKLKSTIERRRLSERNKTFVLAIMTPGLLVYPLLFLHFCLMMIEGIVLSCKSMNLQIFHSVYLNSFLEVKSKRIFIKQKRNELQTSRSCSSLQFIKGFSLSSRKLSLLFSHGFPQVEERYKD